MLNYLVIYILLPALILSTLQNVDRSFVLGREVLLTNIVVLAVIILLGWLYTRLFQMETPIANSYIIGGVLGNVAFIGPPFIAGLIPAAAPALSVIVALHLSVIFSLGIIILESTRGDHVHIGQLIKQIVLNPLLLSLALGGLLFWLGWSLPAPVLRPIRWLGVAAGPVALVSAGIFVVGRAFTRRAIMHASIISALKLTMLPVLIMLAAYVSHRGNMFQISILTAGMPIACTMFALTERYPIDKDIAAKSIIISSLLSIFTLAVLTRLV